MILLLCSAEEFIRYVKKLLLLPRVVLSIKAPHPLAIPHASDKDKKKESAEKKTNSKRYYFGSSLILYVFVYFIIGLHILWTSRILGSPAN